MLGKRRRGRPPHDDVLTPAEWRIVHAVRHGMSNREIARRRAISLDAVKYHVENAVAKLGLRNRQELRRWRGIPKHSALHRRLAREDDTMTNENLGLGPLGQISRTVSDIAQAEAWYGGVLGLKHLYTFGKLAFFDLGGTRLYLSAEQDKAGQESILYLRVGDIAAAHAALAARGVEFTAPPHMIFRHGDGTEEWMAFFKDPDGRPLALMSQVKG
ncbi:MAG TPA: LuxR C-terminal-related transcriptional regulator [Gammaproteobacteria bacterium]|nr:LuxR C-terminal-related transcriptional regulator [Gammaproteobacteria bacterium]